MKWITYRIVEISQCRDVKIITVRLGLLETKADLFIQIEGEFEVALTRSHLLSLFEIMLTLLLFFDRSEDPSEIGLFEPVRCADENF